MVDLEQHYRAYLRTLDDRRFDDLVDFVHDEVTYNGRVLRRRQYADLVRESAERIPDLRYDARLVVTQGDLVACRLWFDCTVREEFRGIVPTGRPVQFAEHVLYRFRDGRIEEVWSVIDVDAAREQSAAASVSPRDDERPAPPPPRSRDR